jgi:predicted ribosome quality control (RQC) complex YloA/Tae2 family protein
MISISTPVVSMKLSMSNLDIMVCARELKNAIGARVDNVYELDGIFMLRLHARGGGRLDLLVEPGRRVHLTEAEYRPPERPTGFAMLLRKHLRNARLEVVSQPGFERILEFEFQGRERRLLVAELFGEGNLIICDDKRVIIQPYRVEIWRHRALKPGEKYAYPPKRGTDFRSLDINKLRDAILGAPDIVRGLAINLNLGGALAEEICARAKVSKDNGPADLNQAELRSLLNSIESLLREEPVPQIVYDDSKPVDVAPFDFVSHLGKRAKRFETFNQALDEYFGAATVQTTTSRIEERFDREERRLRQRLDEQKARLLELETKGKDEKTNADLITTHHADLDETLQHLMKLRQKRGWRGLQETLDEARKSGEKWAANVRAVDPRAGKVEVGFDGKVFSLNLRLSSFENASRSYIVYKKLMEKADGAREAVSRTEGELNELLLMDVPKAVTPCVKKRRKIKWFERFRWFISSDGVLVIGGRDTATNQEVVEKHMEPGDRYIHADIFGAPHVVVKAGGKEISEATLMEAAGFAAINSRAWREGLGSLKVFWAHPEQVSKRAPSGEYLPRGSYVIKGKRNFLKVQMGAAIGVVTLDGEKMVMCGPQRAVEHYSKVVIPVAPGPVKKSDLAKKIQARLKAGGEEVSINELMRALPPGKGQIG